jgi:hypothetical protein
MSEDRDELAGQQLLERIARCRYTVLCGHSISVRLSRPREGWCFEHVVEGATHSAATAPSQCNSCAECSNSAPVPKLIGHRAHGDGRETRTKRRRSCAVATVVDRGEASGQHRVERRELGDP